MSKVKTVWHCRECGHQEGKWSGCCNSCGTWNSFHEEEVSDARFVAQDTPSGAVPVGEVNMKPTPRISSKISELDRLLGGGIVRGSLTLVGGDPGIGKSTLLLQLSENVARQGLSVLYICGEESVEQTSLRARRLGVGSQNLLLLSETQFSLIAKQVDTLKPDLLIVDSIQIVYKSELHSAPGSVSQVREVATEFMHLAKRKGVATFLIGHVTKSGEIAGPRVLEHLVDTVLYFEGGKQVNYRLLRGVKNRFGPTDEIALFQMRQKGLEPVPNASSIFIEERRQENSGSVVIPMMEGSRPILVEVQALVTTTAFTTPSRRSQGIDSNRLALLLAVMERQAGYQLFNRDVFVSVAGGIRLLEPAGDLGILVAIASSLIDRKVKSEVVIIGEVGLCGEVRTVPLIEQRVREALQMGFSRVILPKSQAEVGIEGMQCVGVENVQEAIKQALS